MGSTSRIRLTKKRAKAKDVRVTLSDKVTYKDLKSLRRDLAMAQGAMDQREREADFVPLRVKP